MTKTIVPQPVRPNYDPAPRNKSGIQYFYQSLVGWGIIVTEHGGVLIIQAPQDNVSPALRKAIEARRVALVAHIRSLPR